jgi:signal transduction histidine kinase
MRVEPSRRDEPQLLATHAVQFYEDEAHRVAELKRFVADGRARGQKVIVILRDASDAALSHVLDLHAQAAPGAVTTVRAGELLASFMVGPAPDPAMFARAMSSLLGVVPGHPTAPPPRVYGEMVDMLWESQQPDAAMQIEELWNAFVARWPVELLCVYRMDRFRKAADSARFEQICHMHHGVLPTKDYQPVMSEPERLRQFAVLQQRSRALDHEVESRRVSEKLIGQAQAMRDDFVVIAGHELRTPLTVIQLQVQHLLRSTDADVPARVQRALALTARGVDRLAMLVEQVLEVSRIEAGRLFLQLGPVDLAVVIRQAVARLPNNNDADAAPIVVQADDGLLGRWDITRIDGIVTTLLSNARKFGACQPIDVAVVRAGNMARLTVRDRGAGITPGDQERIFQRYARGEATVGGLGLALWIAREVIVAHGGTISVESAPGEGATFSVELPLVDANHPHRVSRPIP